MKILQILSTASIHVEDFLKTNGVIFLRIFFFIYFFFDGNFNMVTNKLQDFFTFLNSLHTLIEFTMELESSGTSPFLDILFSRCIDHIEFSIYLTTLTTPLTRNWPLWTPFSTVCLAFPCPIPILTLNFLG